MDIIYQPRGKAREYAPLAVNLFNGCVHGCRYCYVPKVVRKTPKEFHDKMTPKTNVLERLEKDARKIAGDDREILLCFACDPYPPFEIEQGITREAIKILIKYELRFTILTKGGVRAARDFDLLRRYARCSFGTTLTSDRMDIVEAWEPLATVPDPRERMEVIRLARSLYINTWVSLEPVVHADSAFNLILLLYEDVDHWKIGKLNYHDLDIDWIWFREQVKALLEDQRANYYIKKSLAGGA